MTTPRFLITFLVGVIVGTAGAADRPSNLPPNPGRPSPPPGINDHAVAVGARAPAFSLPIATGGSWDLSSAISSGPAVLVFYRGDW
jgi:hypothetical protein